MSIYLLQITNNQAASTYQFRNNFIAAMKKLILLELAFLFFASTFQSHNPPGWYQLQLPVSDFTKDISFVDNLNGWIITEGNFNNNDTGYNP